MTSVKKTGDGRDSRGGAAPVGALFPSSAAPPLSTCALQLRALEPRTVTAKYLGILAVGKALGAEFGTICGYLLSLSPCGRWGNRLICLTQVSESGRGRGHASPPYCDAKAIVPSSPLHSWICSPATAKTPWAPHNVK